MSRRDAAKACATSDKNVSNVFEQHLCWPEGRVPFMGRVNVSQAVRKARYRRRHRISGIIHAGKPGVTGRAAWSRPVSGACYGVA
ncbi:hypothetical protein F164LOC_12345 [Pectobacterium carotovorum]|nr:hypothetical protein F164LOC_12345 [Pectobacterium carotovorum]